MNVLEAYNLSIKICEIPYGSDGQYFALLGWKSPTTGQESGPYYISCFRGIAIEVSDSGHFQSTFPDTTEGYFPWLKYGRGKKKSVKNLKVLKEEISRILTKLEEEKV